MSSKLRSPKPKALGLVAQKWVVGLGGLLDSWPPMIQDFPTQSIHVTLKNLQGEESQC